MLDDHERARRFQALLDHDPDFIVLGSMDGTVDFVNESGRRLVGLDDTADLSRLTVDDLLTIDPLAERAATALPAAVGGPPRVGTGTLRDWRGGTAIPVEGASFVVRDHVTDEALGTATVQRDLRPSLLAAQTAEEVRAALVEGGERDRALLHHLSDILLVVTPRGELRYTSPSASRTLGCPQGWAVGTDLLELVHPDDRDATRVALEDVTPRATGRAPGSVLMALRLSSEGGFRHYEALANDLTDNPAVAGILLVVRDVTERFQAEAAARAQARVLELIAGEAPVPDVLAALALLVEGQLEDTLCTVLLVEGTTTDRFFSLGASPSMPPVYESTLEGCLIEGHPSPCGLAVRSREPVLVEDIFADPRFAPMLPLARVCGVRACWSFPVLSPTSGTLLGTFALYTRQPGLPDGRTAAVVARASGLVAITLDRHVLLRRLAHRAEHDELTGLPNRLSLLSRLRARLRRPPATGSVGPGVMFLDLDRLKIVNDSLGHDVGDELLVRIAERLTNAVPEGTLVARFGGDEFVLLLDRLVDAAEGARLAQRVLAAVAAPVQLAGRMITPSASAGLAIAEPGQNAVDVLRDADIAMYRAKHGGGASFAFFTEDMRLRAFDRLDLEEQIRHGLANEEFRVVYQPVVDLVDGDALVGFEALVRWQHPDRGLLSPASFIDLAEETGLIVELGEWVLRTVAATVAGWVAEVPQVTATVAVNLAAHQLLSPQLAACVRSTLDTVAPWRLSLELTESTLMSDTAGTRRMVDELVALGAFLAIDDFGTGFSSLSYLTRLPVQTLKIDRTFVQDLGNPGAAAVADAVVTLAHSLDLTVVAEGIETDAQLAAVREMGCHFGQGYLLGRPMPPAAALECLRATLVPPSAR